jgi:hypothetical protein
MTQWELEGRELINCNCSYGCPCQFNALPTHGFCEAIGAFVVDKGHYGDVPLDGLKVAMVLHWPGPIHQGGGTCQPIVDATASEQQREALLRIMSGQDTEPLATVFAVFATTFDKVFDPIVAPIDFDVDVDGRRGRARVDGVLEMDGEPIRNPVTGKEHRARIELPAGFEYEIAEIGSGTSRSSGKVALDLKDSYAQFARIHLSNNGVVRHRTTA